METLGVVEKVMKFISSIIDEETVFGYENGFSNDEKYQKMLILKKIQFLPFWAHI